MTRFGRVSNPSTHPGQKGGFSDGFLTKLPVEGRHALRVVLQDTPLKHVVEHRSHFLIKLPGSAENDFITLGFTHAHVADVNAAGV